MAYNFTTYLEDDDSIQMDIDAARSYINGTMDSDLGSILKNLQQFAFCAKKIYSFFTYKYTFFMFERKIFVQIK